MILHFTLNLNMVDEVSTGIKTTCLQYNSTFRLGIHLIFLLFSSHLELKEILIFSAGNKVFPRAKTSHNTTELKA